MTALVAFNVGYSRIAHSVVFLRGPKYSSGYSGRVRMKHLSLGVYSNLFIKSSSIFLYQYCFTYQ